ncbi:glycosyl transferase family protein [Exidia glandulosa HHB12029]|uniref:Glycosyl transferase family protein n=1 Tax=Exidia glandulosa HHB12029 TaxID=1314781 RepID=A0A165CZ16_EXIGL|nr:glycosyl transferase family protein [Exidia glandulosa HHB12029]
MTSNDNNQAVSTSNPDKKRVVESSKVWTVLLTNTSYLKGTLTLDYSLKRVKSAYPLIVLYTDSLPPEAHHALKARHIPMKHVPYLVPKSQRDYSNDPRFYDCWTKLTPFSLVEYERVVQLDADMLVLQNMDELMDIELDSRSDSMNSNRVFAATHACACNPCKKPHYPKHWVPKNCAYTSQHSSPKRAQAKGAPCTAGIGLPNGGLQVVNPSAETYGTILRALNSTDASSYDFADQSLLGDVFRGRWVSLPYVYNGLKFLRWDGVHDAIWRDASVKNMHYGMNPKPWEETEEMRKKRDTRDETHEWWWEINEERLKEEKTHGVDDGW